MLDSSQRFKCLGIFRALQKLIPVLLLSGALAQADTPDREGRLACFRLPPGEALAHDKDFDQLADFNFIEHHSDVSDADPFNTQRAKKQVPDHAFAYFLSSKSPREIRDFFMKALNDDSSHEPPPDMPFYNSINEVSFDARDEAGDPDDKKSIFYRLALSDGRGEGFAVSIFNRGNGGKTLVYLAAYDEPLDPSHPAVVVEPSNPNRPVTAEPPDSSQPGALTK
jgi:hypothetical protein